MASSVLDLARSWSGSIDLDTGRRPPATGILALHLDANSWIISADDVPVGRWRMPGREAEDGLKGDVAIKSPVVAKHKFIEIGINVLGAEAVVGAKAPALEQRENPMDPLEWDMTGHAADDTRVVAIAFQSRIGGVAIGDQGCARGDVRFDERVKMNGLVARNGRQADATRQSVEISSAVFLGLVRFSGGMVDHLDSTDDENFASLERAGEVVIGTKGHLGLVDLDDAFQRIAVRIDHRAPQLLLQQPSGLVGADPQLPHQLPRRHPVGMRRHQMGRPEPHGQRQFGSMHHRTGSRRRLVAAVPTCVGVGPTGQQDRVSATAFWAGKPVWPPAIHQQTDAAFLVRKPCLKFEERHQLRHTRECIPAFNLSQGLNGPSG